MTMHSQKFAAGNMTLRIRIHSTLFVQVMALVKESYVISMLIVCRYRAMEVRKKSACVNQASLGEEIFVKV